MKSFGIPLMLIGGIAAIWGFTYTASHDLQSGLGELFDSGATTDKFHFATLACPLGAVAAVVGLVFFMMSRSKA